VQRCARGAADWAGARRRFDSVSGSDLYGHPNTEIPEDVLDSIRRNRVRLMRPLFRRRAAVSPVRFAGLIHGAEL
jgi:hypothetical protein